MTGSLDFKARLEAKINEQLRAQRVGYLFGAGSPYLNGAGDPARVKVVVASVTQL